MHQSQIVKTPLGQLNVSDNIRYKGHIYTVLRVTIHDDDTTATVKIGYPRVLEAGFILTKEITDNAMTLIDVYRS